MVKLEIAKLKISCKPDKIQFLKNASIKFRDSPRHCGLQLVFGWYNFL